MSRNRIFAGAATAAVVLGLALGFNEAGSPGLQRLANADTVRMNDLNAISLQVNRHYAGYGKLPQSLAELSWSGASSDPITRTLYEYHPLDERRFQLCAVFATADREAARSLPRGRPHGAGRQCFTYPE